MYSSETFRNCQVFSHILNHQNSKKKKKKKILQYKWNLFHLRKLHNQTISIVKFVQNSNKTIVQMATMHLHILYSKPFGNTALL